jgi:hypothetical protein
VGARVWSGGDGVGDTRQQVRWGDGVAGGDGGVGVLQRGWTAVVVRCRGGCGWW